MIVTRDQFDASLATLAAAREVTVDTETTGLRPYHGSRAFSVICAADDGEPMYYNFLPYEGLPPEQVLTREHLKALGAVLGKPELLKIFTNAGFDLHMLAVEGIELEGPLYCTQVGARVEYNDHVKVYSLAECAAKVGVPKSSVVEDYIYDNKLLTKEKVPGKKTEVEHLHFDRVPFDIIAPYGLQDVRATRAVYQHQRVIAASRPPGYNRVLDMEMRLLKTVHRMERRGVLVDRDYCRRAIAYESDRIQKSLDAFKAETGRVFLASPKLFAEVFKDERDLWEYTDKGNPSFEYDVIKFFKSPAAKAVLAYRDAKSKHDFYQGFLYHADRDGVLHPHFLQDGTATGRFSSFEPNLQNMTSEEDDDLQQEFVVRRAIIPRPGFVFLMPDYEQMEYRMMFDYVCQIAEYLVEIARQIRDEGKDPHQATADTVTGMGLELSRKRAKNGNFAFLYGSGDATLAKTIGAPLHEAQKLRQMLLRATPEMGKFLGQVKTTAKVRGYIVDWLGRWLFCADPKYAYKMPNHLIQGGCADVNKVALNDIDEYLLDKKSKLVLTIHDENPIECHESEVSEVPKRCQELMEAVYPHKYLPMKVSMEWSEKSLADKKKGAPV